MGNHQQIEDWFLEYGDDVYHFLVYYTRSLDVEDAVQEVFLRAMHSASRFEERSSPKTWLLSIARRYVIDQYRKERNRKFFPLDFRKKDTRPLPDELVIHDETLQAIYAEVNALKNSYRNVLICRLILDYTVSETAEILNWPKTKVTMTYHRAIARLKKNMEGGSENE